MIVVTNSEFSFECEIRPEPNDLAFEDFVSLAGVAPKKRDSKYAAVKRIYANEQKGTTCVLFDDGTKKEVKCGAGEQFDIYNAVTAAIAEKRYDNNSALKREIKKRTVYQGGKPAPKVLLSWVHYNRFMECPYCGRKYYDSASYSDQWRFCPVCGIQLGE